MVIADRKLLASEQSNYKSFTTSVNSSNSSVSIPNLLQVQINSFEWFKKQGIKDLLNEINPIEDFTGGRFELKFLGHEISHQGKQTVNISVLEKLCQFLKKGDIWVDTVENIGTYVNQKRSI